MFTDPVAAQLGFHFYSFVIIHIDENSMKDARLMKNRMKRKKMIKGPTLCRIRTHDLLITLLALNRLNHSQLDQLI